MSLMLRLGCGDTRHFHWWIVDLVTWVIWRSHWDTHYCSDIFRPVNQNKKHKNTNWKWDFSSYLKPISWLLWTSSGCTQMVSGWKQTNWVIRCLFVCLGCGLGSAPTLIPSRALSTCRQSLTYGPVWLKRQVLWASRDIRGSLPCIYDLRGTFDWHIPTTFRAQA